MENKSQNSADAGPKDDIVAAEALLKKFLDKLLSYFEKFIDNSEDIQNLEKALKDYESIQSLIEIITSVFDELSKKIDNKMSSSSDTNQYERLEKITQKYEGEIRNHIRVEQQLKLYAESLQSKLDDSEKSRDELLNSTKSMINGVKRDNQKLAENLKQIKEENESLVQANKDLQSINKKYEEKIHDYPILLERVRTLEKTMREYSPSTNNLALSIVQPSANNLLAGEFSNVPPIKKYNFEVDYNKQQIRSEPSNSGLLAYQQHSSPLKQSNKQLQPSIPPDRNLSATNNEYLKVKIEILDGKRESEKTGITRNHHAAPKKTREGRQATSVSKARELRIANKLNPDRNYSNNNLTYINEQKSLMNTSGLQQRSKSISTAPIMRIDSSKSGSDLSNFYPINQESSNWQHTHNFDKKNRYL